MPSFIIVDVMVHDPESYEGYKKLTPASIAKYDGKFIVRGGKTEIIEGDWNPERLVIVEFPDSKRAKEWWNSSEYAPAKKIRHAAAKSKMILAEGY